MLPRAHLGGRSFPRRGQHFPLVVALMTALAVPVVTASPATRPAGLEAPVITITRSPRAGAGPGAKGIVQGKVEGVDPRDHRVVLYALVDQLYVQPTTANPLIRIAPNGRWKSRTHLGCEYHALLVRAGYRPAPVLSGLPPVGGDVLASAGSHPANAPRIRFAGYDWVAKTCPAPIGPGPNLFSGSRRNVRLDSDGKLHLRITRQGRVWKCAEIVSLQSFGYGTYRFDVETPADALDPNVVVGLFTYSRESSFSHREIDVELSRWGNPANANAQFVVQPFTDPRNISRFILGPEVQGSTHQFTWAPDAVAFRSSRLGPDGSPGQVIHEATLTNGIPQAGDEKVRINFWLSGPAPQNGQEAEVVIRDFQFEPL